MALLPTAFAPECCTIGRAGAVISVWVDRPCISRLFIAPGVVKGDVLGSCAMGCVPVFAGVPFNTQHIRKYGLHADELSAGITDRVDHRDMGYRFPAPAVSCCSCRLTLPGTAVQKRNVAVAAGGILVAALGFGLPIHEAVESPRVTVGLISTDALRTISSRRSDSSTGKQYAAHIPDMVSQGAQVVVIPEKIGLISGADLAQADSVMEAVAREQRITISISFEHAPNLNETRLTPAGWSARSHL